MPSPSHSIPPFIEVRGLSKTFPGIRALNDVSVSIHRATVHGIVGENGAGKSTLMRILSGLEQPTTGDIVVEGSVRRIGTPQDADELGIAMIHQELNLVDELSVSDNIFLGRESTTRLGGMSFVNDAHQRKAAGELLQRVRCDIDPARKVKSLSIAQQQLVEIAKALSINARLLIMDEPTAVLSEREASSLFELIATLKSHGVTVLYVSHHLSEVVRVCDLVTVLRDGCVISTVDANQTNEAELARLMVGRPLGEFYPARGRCTQQVRLSVRNVSSESTISGVSFEVRAGEILGFAGLIGAGRTEMAEAIVGLRSRDGGDVEVDGVSIQPGALRHALRAGLAYVSEDRKGRGLTLDMGVTENTTLVSLRKYSKTLINRKAETAAARKHVQRLGIRVPLPRLRAPVRNLSGGNQQKVALAKWLEIEPRVLILDEPTRGVDIGAKREIYDLIVELASQGMACVFISSELPELLGVCHRIAVMHSGSIAAVMEVADATQEKIMHFAAGLEETQRA